MTTAAAAHGIDSTGPDARSRPDRWSWRSAQLLGLVGVFALGLALRLVLIFSGGGPRGIVSDDTAAYYAGSTALVHGRLPYRDFVLLHPPGADLLMTPFAALGTAIGDHGGYLLAVFAVLVLGAFNAVLTVIAARCVGLGAVPSFVAGVFYAVSLGGIVDDFTAWLETFGTTLFLSAIVVLTRRGGLPTRRNLVFGGLLLGAMCTMKLYYVVPAAVVLVWILLRRATRRDTGYVVLGTLAAIVVICGPFFVLAPRAMVRMIIVDQLGRPDQPGARLPKLFPFQQVFVTLSGTKLDVVVGVLSAAFLVAFLFALRIPQARMIAIVAALEVVTIVSSPSFFFHYTAFPAAAVGITVAAAVQGVRTGDRVWRLPALLTWALGAPAAVIALVGTAVLGVGTVIVRPPGSGPLPFPAAQVTRAIAGARCPTPDGPVVLIETNRLSSTLAQGCSNWIDVTGRVYDVDRAKNKRLPRRHNQRWQRDLRRYLFSGDAVILYRPGLGAGAELKQLIRSHPQLVNRDGVTVYQLRPYGRRSAR